MVRCPSGKEPSADFGSCEQFSRPRPRCGHRDRLVQRHRLEPALPPHPFAAGRHHSPKPLRESRRALQLFETGMRVHEGLLGGVLGQVEIPQQ